MFRAVMRLARPAALFLASLSLVACVTSAGAVNPSQPPSATPDPIDPNTPIFRVG